MKIHNLAQLAAKYGINAKALSTESTIRLLEKYVYKYTDCGAWIRVDKQGVHLGSIVEGSDVEIGPVLLPWGFTEEQYDAALQGIEDEAEEAWNEANNDDNEIEDGKE